jgi:hypothetical protein
MMNFESRRARGDLVIISAAIEIWKADPETEITDLMIERITKAIQEKGLTLNDEIPMLDLVDILAASDHEGNARFNEMATRCENLPFTSDP